MEEEKIIFVNYIGQDYDNLYRYEFFLSTTPDVVWCEGWEVTSPAACGEMLPEEGTYNRKVLIETPIQINCAQENTCFSMQDCIDGILALAWWYYGEFQPFVIPFGMDWDLFKEKISVRSDLFKIIEN